MNTGKKFASIMVFSVFAFVLIFGSCQQVSAHSYNKRYYRNYNYGEKVVVTKVIDGDTFKTNRGRTVRINSINAPEYGQIGYRSAKNKAKSTLLGRQVTLKINGNSRDIYGRDLRDVYVNDQNFGNMMLQQGYAKPYR